MNASFLYPYESIPPNFGGPIQYPHVNDVLSGRGNAVNQHTGNVKFRNLAYSVRGQYLRPGLKKLEKVKIAQNLVTYVRTMNPPGRFLKQSDDAWYEIGDERARKKAGQAIRDYSEKEELQHQKHEPLDCKEDQLFGGTNDCGVDPVQSQKVQPKDQVNDHKPGTPHSTAISHDNKDKETTIWLQQEAVLEKINSVQTNPNNLQDHPSLPKVLPQVQDNKIRHDVSNGNKNEEKDDILIENEAESLPTKEDWKHLSSTPHEQFYDIAYSMISGDKAPKQQVEVNNQLPKSSDEEDKVRHATEELTSILKTTSLDDPVRFPQRSHNSSFRRLQNQSNQSLQLDDADDSTEKTSSLSPSATKRYNRRSLGLKRDFGHSSKLPSADEVEDTNISVGQGVEKCGYSSTSLMSVEDMSCLSNTNIYDDPRNFPRSGSSTIDIIMSMDSMGEDDIKKAFFS